MAYYLLKSEDRRIEFSEDEYKRVRDYLKNQSDLKEVRGMQFWDGLKKKHVSLMMPNKIVCYGLSKKVLEHICEISRPNYYFNDHAGTIKEISGLFD